MAQQLQSFLNPDAFFAHDTCAIIIETSLYNGVIVASSGAWHDFNGHEVNGIHSTS